MGNKLRHHQVECCICRDWRQVEGPQWYTPSPQERREYHFEGKRLSHGYCPSCYLLTLKNEGFNESQIEEIVQDVFRGGSA
jgi:hypothetical protein